MTGAADAGSDHRSAAPPPVPVILDPRETALVVMDITDPLCSSRPACVATVPRISSLLADARAAGVAIVHTAGRHRPIVFLDPVAPLPNEPVIAARADKFHDSELETALRERDARTLLLVGTAANGAVLYTAFAANLRGFTVAVAVDAISSEHDATTDWVAWQLVNQPGFTNTTNAPLAAERVTLTRTDLVSFGEVTWRSA
jgi:nicotinamidase-related amidase